MEGVAFFSRHFQKGEREIFFPGEIEKQVAIYGFVEFYSSRSCYPLENETRGLCAKIAVSIALFNSIETAKTVIAKPTAKGATKSRISSVQMRSRV